MNFFTTEEFSKYLLPILIAVTGLLTALVTFFLTASFTHYREKTKTNAENRAYFDYAKYILNYPIDYKNMKFLGEGILLYGKNGNKFEKKVLEDNKSQECSFMIITNETENDLINVVINTSYIGENKIEEKFVIPYWKSTDAIYLFHNEFGYKGDPISEELTIEFTTRTFENLKYQFKRNKNTTYKEGYQKKVLKLFWRDMISFKQREPMAFQKLKLPHEDEY